MGKEFPLKPDQRGQDAGQEVPMRTPRQLYAAERIIITLNCSPASTAVTSW